MKRKNKKGDIITVARRIGRNLDNNFKMIVRDKVGRSEFKPLEKRITRLERIVDSLVGR